MEAQKGHNDLKKNFLQKVEIPALKSCPELIFKVINMSQDASVLLSMAESLFIPVSLKLLHFHFKISPTFRTFKIIISKNKKEVNATSRKVWSHFSPFLGFARFD